MKENILFKISITIYRIVIFSTRRLFGNTTIIYFYVIPELDYVVMIKLVITAHLVQHSNLMLSVGCLTIESLLNVDSG